MGYACPVCSDPQADAGHLANHLAFTSILGDRDHEQWLDEHAPGWGEMGEADLADVLADQVEETEFPQHFEDTVGGLEEGSTDPPTERSGALFDDSSGHGHAHDHDQDHAHTDADAHDHEHGSDAGVGHDHDTDHGVSPGHGQTGTHVGPANGDASGVADTAGLMDETTAEVLEEARELTRRMHADEEEVEADESGVDEIDAEGSDETAEEMSSERGTNEQNSAANDGEKPDGDETDISAHDDR